MSDVGLSGYRIASILTAKGERHSCQHMPTCPDYRLKIKSVDFLDYSHGILDHGLWMQGQRHVEDQVLSHQAWSTVSRRLQA